MSDSVKPKDPQPSLPENGARRRSLITALAAGAGATFFGPWKVHHAWAQAAQKKPLIIGRPMRHTARSHPS